MDKGKEVVKSNEESQSVRKEVVKPFDMTPRRSPILTPKYLKKLTDKQKMLYDFFMTKPQSVTNFNMKVSKHVFHSPEPRDHDDYRERSKRIFDGRPA